MRSGTLRLRAGMFRSRWARPLKRAGGGESRGLQQALCNGRSNVPPGHTPEFPGFELHVLPCPRKLECSSDPFDLPVETPLRELRWDADKHLRRERGGQILEMHFVLVLGTFQHFFPKSKFLLGCLPSAPESRLDCRQNSESTENEDVRVNKRCIGTFIKTPRNPTWLL